MHPTVIIFQPISILHFLDLYFKVYAKKVSLLFFIFLHVMFLWPSLVSFKRRFQLLSDAIFSCTTKAQPKNTYCFGVHASSLHFITSLNLLLFSQLQLKIFSKRQYLKWRLYKATLFYVQARWKLTSVLNSASLGHLVLTVLLWPKIL